jgi:hypothetical protein
MRGMAAWCLGILLVSGCAADDGEEAREHLARWKERGPSSYVYVGGVYCYCGGPVGPLRAVVQDGEVASVVQVSTGLDVAPDDAPTMTELLEMLTTLAEQDNDEWRDGARGDPPRRGELHRGYPPRTYYRQRAGLLPGARRARVLGARAHAAERSGCHPELQRRRRLHVGHAISRVPHRLPKRCDARRGAERRQRRGNAGVLARARLTHLQNGDRGAGRRVRCGALRAEVALLESSGENHAKKSTVACDLGWPDWL